MRSARIVGKHRIGTPHDNGEMTFEEIGERLGITRGGAWMLYKKAMKKLRHAGRRRDVAGLRELIEFKLRREL